MTESMFSRLFTYARSSSVSQIENFTTEALAAAIRIDPSPFYVALARHGVVPGPMRAERLVVSTQESMPNVGIIDLIVRELEHSTITKELWVEAKVWAGESGDQLARYSRSIASRMDGVERVLIVLGPRPVGAVSGVPWLPWQAVRDGVKATDRSNAIWQELSQFLEERNVADLSTDPMSAREIASLRDAHNLFVKATRVLTLVNARATDEYPTWGWGGKDQITQTILGQFQRHARLTITTTQRPVYLVLGYSDLFATGEAHLSVWVESDPKKVDVRAGMHEVAAIGQLSDRWIRRLDSWQGLSVSQRAVTVEGVEANVGWFVDRLSELAAAGLAPTGSAAG